ncbi:MAG: hypothetical protein ACUVRZ_07105 [Desulfobacca sp.]|uniref:hypothetical protein n=1 Tax=Desulfobacca sp. TaxID=2067990 RepID=UPI004049FADA
MPFANPLASWQAILCQQYAWHEAPHWPPLAPGEEAPVVVPQIHTLADIYKCLYQGEFGIGHSISSPAMFRELLERELRRSGPATPEPLLESVAPLDAILRVNIRPYALLFPQDLPQACQLLVEVCLASSQRVKGRPERFLATLAAFGEFNRAGGLQAEGRIFIFPPEQVVNFLQQVRDFLDQQGSLPVLSHSAVYRRYNAPSYRVVSREVLAESQLGALILAKQ